MLAYYQAPHARMLAPRRVPVSVTRGGFISTPLSACLLVLVLDPLRPGSIRPFSLFGCIDTKNLNTCSMHAKSANTLVENIFGTAAIKMIQHSVEEGRT